VTDWGAILGVVLLVAVLAIMVERGLSIGFEYKFWVASGLDDKGLKEPIAFLVAYLICKAFSFDAIGMLLGKTVVSTAGMVVTAAVIAGGSKGSQHLFSDLLNIKSSAARAADAGKVP
jgi:hypothetical protein